MAGTSNRQRRHRNEADYVLILDHKLRSDLRNLGHHIDLCELHPTEIDGFKANHGYEGGGTGGVKWIVDENGQKVAVDATHVEAAALARARTIRDEHGSAVHDAEKYRSQLLVAWSGMCAALTRADAAQINNDVPDEKRCGSCKRAGIQGEAEHWGTVAGKLDTNWWLCAPCYKFVYDHGRLPTVEEVKHYSEKGRWRLRAS